VFNPVLKYAGTLDFSAWLPGLALAPGGDTFIPGDGVSGCFDTKTGKNPGITWREQIAAYRRARYGLLPMGELAELDATDFGAVLHLRPEHHRGYQLMPISRAKDAVAWNRFRRAAEIVRGRADDDAKPGRVVRPLRADGTMPAPLLADLGGEGYGRALTPLRKAGIEDLEQISVMTAGQLLAVKGIGGKTVDAIRLMLDGYGLSLAGEAVPQGEAA
jgi:hypothetical protein